MTCENNVCGTGGWGGPQPGDPDNNITLSVRTVYGGLLVSWSYPLINGHAVAYTDVYRATSSDFDKAVHLDKSGGSSYRDAVDPESETEYFYWIEVVSIHGTRGARIGPAMGIARPQVEQTLESLTGRIDDGLLAQTLKTDISGITLNNAAIYQEIRDRLAANEALQNAIAAVTSNTDEALTYIANEIVERRDADSALVKQINAIAAGLGDAVAAIVEERTVRATKDSVIAQDITTIYGRVQDNEAAIIDERKLRVEQDKVELERYNTLYGRMGKAEGSIQGIENLTLTPNSALATKLTSLTTNSENAASAIQALDTSLATGTHALAKSVRTVEATLNGNVGTGQTGLVAEVNSVTGALDVMYFAKVQANGLIGGFGIWNNGAEVQAGFDVDTFWIGRTNANKVKPFIIADDKVFINEAHIRTASIDSLKLKGEAVTVPIVSSSPDVQKKGKGEGTWTQINEGYISLEQDGLVYILVTMAQGFNKVSDRYWGFQIRVDGQVQRYIMGRQANDAPSMSKSIGLTKGTHKIEVYWSAHPDVICGYCEMFMMGVKR